MSNYSAFWSIKFEWSGLRKIVKLGDRESFIFPILLLFFRGMWKCSSKLHGI